MHAVNLFIFIKPKKAGRILPKEKSEAHLFGQNSTAYKKQGVFCSKRSAKARLFEQNSTAHKNITFQCFPKLRNDDFSPFYWHFRT
jgi:hypothetical protein